MNEITFYDLLGVTPTATKEEITAAYDKQVAVLDDKDGLESRILQGAYLVLSYDNTRAEYDMTVMNAMNQPGSEVVPDAPSAQQVRNLVTPQPAVQKKAAPRPQAASKPRKSPTPAKAPKSTSRVSSFQSRTPLIEAVGKDGKQKQLTGAMTTKFSLVLGGIMVLVNLVMGNPGYAVMLAVMFAVVGLYAYNSDTLTKYAMYAVTAIAFFAAGSVFTQGIANIPLTLLTIANVLIFLGVAVPAYRKRLPLEADLARTRAAMNAQRAANEKHVVLHHVREKQKKPRNWV